MKTAATAILAGLVLMGCDSKPYDSFKEPCTVIPADQRKPLADFEVACIKAATATNTGENQDAEVWVEACHKNALEVFGKPGYRWYSYIEMQRVPKSICKEPGQ